MKIAFLTFLAVVFAFSPLLATRFTPAEWKRTVGSGPLAGQRKLTQTTLDSNKNFIDDALEALPTSSSPQVVVLMNKCLSEAVIRSRFGSYGTVLFISRYVSSVVVDNVPKSRLAELAADADVAFVELSRTVTGELPVSARSIKARASIISPGVNEGLGLTGRNVNIAILDSGIDDALHESLPGSKFVAGYNAFTDTPENPDDDREHGTIVAGISSGTGGPSGENRGVAYDSRFVDVKTLDSNNTAPAWVVGRAIDRTIQMHNIWQSRIMNLSLGYFLPGRFDGTDFLSQLVDTAVEDGMVAVVAAGNYFAGEPQNPFEILSPGTSAKAITVANARDMNTVPRGDDIIFAGSRRGPRGDGVLKPDIAAPGTGILSPRFNTTSGYVFATGTSMAAPHVAGVAALMLQARPGLSNDTIKQVLRQTAESAPTIPAMETNGIQDSLAEPKFDVGSGFGLIDAFAAVSAIGATEILFPSCLPNAVAVGTPCLLSSNDQAPPRWANQTDILLASEPPVAGVPNTIRVKVRNSGPANAAGVEVTIGVYEFAAGNIRFYTIGVLRVGIPAGATVELQQPWTPELGHKCIQVSLAAPLDTNTFNNVTQRNIDVKATASPAVFPFQVENRLPAGAIIEIGTLVNRSGWTCTVDRPRFAMHPCKDCPQMVQVTSNPVAGPGPVAGAITPNGRQLLGGVTARAVDSVRGTADCHVYVYARTCDTDNDAKVDINDIRRFLENRVPGSNNTNNGRTCSLVCDKPNCAI